MEEKIQNLTISTSPHIKGKDTTRTIMRDVLIALLPATVMAIVLYGLKALFMIVTCLVCSVGSEFLFNLITKRKQTIGDLSAAVTGLLLALNLSAKVGIWQCVIGSVFAIVVVKCLFGGIGHNFANPAITGRILLLISFPTMVAGGINTQFAEIEAGATPLEALKNGATLEELPSLLDMFLGLRGGAIGEGCAIALLIGFLYLLIRRVITYHTPVIFVGTVYILSWIIERDPLVALYEVLGGGLLLGAIFMATDYVTTPINKRGKMVFALGCGLITVLIRFFGSYPEGVSFSILLMNILTPYIEKWCAKKPFGGVKNEK